MMQYRLLTNGLHDLAPGVFAPVRPLASLELQVHACPLLASQSSGLRRDWRDAAVDAPWQLDAFLAVQSRSNRIEFLSAPSHSDLSFRTMVPRGIESKCESLNVLRDKNAVQQFDGSLSPMHDTFHDQLDLGCVLSAFATQVQPGAIADSSITVTTHSRPRMDASIGASQSDVRADCEERFGAIFSGHHTVVAELKREPRLDSSDVVLAHHAEPLSCFGTAGWLTSDEAEGLTSDEAEGLVSDEAEGLASDEAETGWTPAEREEVAVAERPASDQSEAQDDLLSADSVSEDLLADGMTRWSAIAAADQATPPIANASTMACVHITLDWMQCQEVSWVASAGHAIEVSDVPSVVVASASFGNDPCEGGRCEVLAGGQSLGGIPVQATSVMDCGVNEIQDSRGWSTRAVASELDFAGPLSAFTQVIRFHVQMRFEESVSATETNRGKIETPDSIQGSVNVFAAARCHWNGRVDTAQVSVAGDTMCQELVRSWQIGVDRSCRGSWYQWESSRAQPIQRRARSFQQIVCNRSNGDLFAKPHGNSALVVEYAMLPAFDLKAANAIQVMHLFALPDDSPRLTSLLSASELIVDGAPAFRFDPDCTLGKNQRSVSMVIPEQPATLPRLIRESFAVVECAPVEALLKHNARKAVTVANAGSTLAERETLTLGAIRWQLELKAERHLAKATSKACLYATSTETWAFGDGVVEEAQSTATSDLSSLPSDVIQHVWNASSTGVPESASEHEVWAASSLIDAATSVDAVAQPPRFAAARGVIQIRFAQKVVPQAIVTMNQTFAVVGDLSRTVGDWHTSNQETCMAFGGSVLPIGTNERDPCVYDPSDVEVTSSVSIVGLQDRAVAEHRTGLGQGQTLVAPAFSGNRCTSCFVPQFHNSAAFASVSRERVRRTNRPILAMACRLEQPAVRSSVAFSNFAISMHSAAASVTRRNVCGVQHAPVDSLGSQGRAEGIATEPRMTERELSVGDRPPVPHSLDESLEQTLPSNQGTGLDRDDRRSFGLQIDANPSWSIRSSAYEGCGVADFPCSSADLAQSWRMQSHEDVSVRLNLEGMSEDSLQMLGAGVVDHVEMSAHAVDAMHPGENSGPGLMLERVINPPTLGGSSETDETRTVMAASFCENTQSKSVAMRLDAILPLGQSTWGIGISQSSDEVRAFIETRNFAVGSRVNLSHRAVQSMGMLVLSNLMFTQKLGDLDMGRQELAWHAAFFASPLRTALVTSQLRSQLVGIEDRFRGSELEPFEAVVDTFDARCLESQHHESQILMTGPSPKTDVDVQEALGMVTKLAIPTTLGFSTEFTLDSVNSVHWSCENDVDSARPTVLPVTKPMKAPHDRWNRPRAA